MDCSLTYRELENKVFQLLHSHLKNKHVLIAVSGGLDSVVLTNLLLKLQPKLNLRLTLAHVFHGPDRNTYRSRAYNLVKDLSRKNNLSFVSNVLDHASTFQKDDLGFEFPLSDEQSLREFRGDVIRNLATLTGAELIATGHHRDDLLETRLIRLIRGVGREGLRAMTLKSPKIVRPLLPFWRTDLQAIAKQMSWDFLEDPSNQDVKYFRNWIRQIWLPSLEKYRPGGTRRMAQSLDNLVRHSKLELDRLRSLIFTDGVDRLGVAGLPNVDQRQVLASYLKLKNVKNYSVSHVDEVLKRLNSNRTEFEFRVAGQVWKVSRSRVRVASL